MKLLLNPEYDLYEKDGQAFCDSLQVAETFEKRHDDVLKSVRNLISDADKEFSLRNFAESNYSDRGKRYPRYLMTKDGFTLLAMGYRGKKATAFKIAYIRRFNEMEAFILSMQATRIEFPAFTEAVMLAHDEPKHYHFSNEINMIYRIVLGTDAKGYREQYGLEKGAVIKPFLTLEQIQALETLQRIDIGLLEAELDYEQRKARLTSRYQRMGLKISA